LVKLNPISLQKILELERKKGYQDTAVIGGLDKFLSFYLRQVSGTSDSSSNLVASVIKSLPEKYTLMNGSEREEWVEKTLQKLEKKDQVQDQSSKEKSSPKSKATKSQISSNQHQISKEIVKRPPAAAFLDAPLSSVKGISQLLSKKFEKLGLTTVRNMLYFFPNRHIDYSQRALISNLSLNQEHTVIVNVWEAHEVRLGTRRSTEATVGDESGNIRVVWFNQPYLAKTLKTGHRIVISGRVSAFSGMLQFESPEWEFFEEKDLVHTGRLVPVYPLTQGLGQRQVRRLVKSVIDQWADYAEEFLPSDIIKRLKLAELKDAIKQAHYPDNEEKKQQARRRLAFDELFLLQLGVLKKKTDWQENRPGIPLEIRSPELTRFLGSLPYKLTPAQERVLNEILADLKNTKPMSRLLQGEVGSGKTVVATAAMLTAVVNGFQCAIMAPTEILAEQHFTTIRRVLSQVAAEEGEGNLFVFNGFLQRPLTVGLLLGDLKQARKQKVQDKIVSGEVDIVIGTHALIQKGVEYARLGLAVIDEQHRFGVEQRSALRQKGTNPHILVMTATPIPRTLALTLFGDLDLSTINELPPGRQTIKTRWLRPEQRETAYNFIRKQVELGRQAFIICPLVEESESIQARAAVAEYEMLAGEVFHDLRLGLLHGRMPSQEKDQVMQKFAERELDILVSTPVVEVGIDVPNATVMMIESADRFGLSQLHQFRGRVGRGKEQSYCMLMAEKPSEIGKERLDLIEKIHNGFLLAEEDLKLRGPGEFFGTRQSGLPDLKMAKLSDIQLLEAARNEAKRLFGEDPDLSQNKNCALAVQLAKVWKQDISTEWS